MKRVNLSIRVDSLFLSLSLIMLILFSFTPGLTSQIYIMHGTGVYLTFIFSLIVFYTYRSDSFSFKRMWISDGLVLLMLLSMLFSNNYNLKNGAFDQAIYFITIFMSYIILSKSDKWHSYLERTYLIFTGFFLIMTFYELVDPDFFKEKVMPLFVNYNSISTQLINYKMGYISGFTANAGVNAMILTIGLGFCFARWLTTARNKMLPLMGVIIYFIAVLITGKRGHTLFCLLAMVLTYLISKSENGFKKAFKLGLITVVFIIVIEIASVLVPEVNNTVSRFAGFSSGTDITTGRSLIWSLSFSSFLQNPVFGSGWDSMKYIIGVNSHNVYIQLLCETGIFGFAIFLSFFIISLIHCLKACKIYNINKIEIPKVLLFSAFVEIFFLLYCITGNPLYDACSLFVYVLSCAIGEYYFHHGHEMTSAIANNQYRGIS